MRPIDEARKLLADYAKKKPRKDATVNAASTFKPSTTPECEKCGKYHQATEDGTCPTTEVHLRTIDELRKLQQETIKAVKDHPTGGKILDDKISRILNTLAKSAGDTPKSPRKARTGKADCYKWLRGDCSRTQCYFKHDPARKGSDHKAGPRKKEGTADDSTKDQPKDAPDKVESDGSSNSGHKEMAAVAFTAH